MPSVTAGAVRPAGPAAWDPPQGHWTGVSELMLTNRSMVPLSSFEGPFCKCLIRNAGHDSSSWSSYHEPGTILTRTRREHGNRFIGWLQALDGTMHVKCLQQYLKGGKLSTGWLLLQLWWWGQRWWQPLNWVSGGRNSRSSHGCAWWGGART